MIINCVDISKLNSEYDLLRKAVSEERREKADKYRFREDSIRCICAEILLQYSMHKEQLIFNIENLYYNDFGKPYIKGCDKFYFSISHSGEWVLLAYDDNEIGVDIEKIQYVEKRVVDDFFTEKEKEYVYSQPEKDRDKRFTQIWTSKESYVKYKGTGFLDNNVFKMLNLENDLYINSRIFNENYYLSVCGNKKNVLVNEIDKQDIVQFVKNKYCCKE